MSQFPNLNSLFGVSLIGAFMGIAYCTVIWILPVASDSQRTQVSVSYATMDKSFVHIFNAIGLIALVYRGNNLVLEIQVLTNSQLKHDLDVFKIYFLLSFSINNVVSLG